MKFILILLISFPAFAKPSFTLLLQRKFDKTWYKISQEKKNWVCETNHYPYFEAKENPLAQLDWKALEKESKLRPKGCDDLVAFSNSLEGKEKRLVTCLSQKETQALYVRISDLCRSKI